MSLEAVLPRLQGVRRSGTGWMALCPAHKDKNPSLSVRADNGRVLLHCFAGCTVEAICSVLQIKMRDLFSEPCAACKPEPRVVRATQKEIAGLRSRLTPRERDRPVTVVQASRENPDLAIARALALAVEGELVQVTFDGEGQ